MDFTQSRDKTALKRNPSSNSVDFKYFIPLTQGCLQKKHGDGQLPHHAFISHTLCRECTRADRAM